MLYVKYNNKPRRASLTFHVHKESRVEKVAVIYAKCCRIYTRLRLPLRLAISKFCAVSPLWTHRIFRRRYHLSFLDIAGQHNSPPQSQPPDIDWNNSPDLPSYYFHLDLMAALWILESWAHIHVQCLSLSLSYPRCVRS